MASRIRGGRLSSQEIEALNGQHAALVHSLRGQVLALESERDQLRQAVGHLTDALRRRGCCDHDTSGGAL